MAAKKLSKKDKSANARYRMESRWIANEERRRKQHEKRLKKKDAHMKRRARVRKKTPADLRWLAKQEQKKKDAKSKTKRDINENH